MALTTICRALSVPADSTAVPSVKLLPRTVPALITFPLVDSNPLLNVATPSVSVKLDTSCAPESEPDTKIAVPSVNVTARTRPLLDILPLEIEPLVERLPAANVPVPSVRVEPERDNSPDRPPNESDAVPSVKVNARTVPLLDKTPLKVAPFATFI